MDGWTEGKERQTNPKGIRVGSYGGSEPTKTSRDGRNESTVVCGCVRGREGGS